MDGTSIAQPRGEHDSIKVLVRVRPLSLAETEGGTSHDSVVDILNSQALNVTSADGKKSFKCAFDSVLGPASSQAEVYEIVKGCTESVIEGINSTIFAYGQTGSGKTYSMYGPPNSVVNQSTTSRLTHRNADQLGLIPRAIEQIFELVHRKEITEFQVHCSFVQIYNENLFDMLRDSSMTTPLSIREDKKEIYVQGLSEYNVKSVADTLQLLKIAEDNRAIRETNMNMFSSRSHSIFQIQLEHKRVADDGGEITYKAKFNLVDLAGSEKWNTKLQMKDEHIAEMTNINLSLHTLGKCISALAQASQRQNREAESRAQTRQQDRERLGSGDWDSRSLGSLDHSGSTIGSIKDFPVPKSGRYSNSAGGGGGGNGSGNNSRDPGTHVPYRESKLTRLLQDSLGGNAKTFLIATVSPARANSEESISTLKFADRAKQVMVQAVVNESRPVDYALVKRLQQEVEMLKGLLKRLVQAQNPNNGAGSATANINAAIFNAKLKQASSVSDFHDLINSGSGLNVNGAENGNTRSQASSPFSMGSPSRVYSPDRKHSVNSSPPTVVSAAGVGGEGSSLEYVISLEKALNQEQIHSQHLAQKNTTLIKELEGLKLQNMQLLQGQGQGQQNGGHINNSSPAPLERQISINSLAITPSQVTQVIASVQGLLAENRRLNEQVDHVQKIMKRFFKFQIEEEDMKKALDGVFTVMKEIKASSVSTSVVDNFAFLEFLATKASATQSPNKASDISTSPMDAMYATGISQSQQASQQPDTVTKKQLRRLNDPVMGQQNQLPSMENLRQSGGAGKVVGGGMNVAGVPVRENKKSQAYIAQKELAQQRSLPSLHSPTGAEEASRTVQAGRNIRSGGSDLGMNMDDLHYQQPLSQNSHAHRYPDQAMVRQQASNIDSHQQGAFGKYGPGVVQQASPVQGLTYRVRGGGNPHQQQQSQALGSSTSSLGSSGGGWVIPAEEDAAAAEAALKAELKQAKKKMKKQQKMVEWQRIKEEKQRAEQEAEEAQRAAEAEAELQKEQKRKEYAQKQKQKLAQYQSKIKTEAEKIQELKNLGIDPSSLF